MRVTTAASVTRKVSYNDGVSVRPHVLVDNAALAVGDYAYTYNAIVVSARSWVTAAVNGSAAITSEKGN